MKDEECFRKIFYRHWNWSIDKYNYKNIIIGGENMLKIFTIYSMVLIIYSMILCICKIIKSDEVENRIISFLSIALYCTMLYVLVEMLKML